MNAQQRADQEAKFAEEVRRREQAERESAPTKLDDKMAGADEFGTPEYSESIKDYCPSAPTAAGAVHPVQPLELINGVRRFKANAIVRLLLDAGPLDMNQLAVMPFSVEDREQFAQLIGYSLSGFGELSYVTDATYERAESTADAHAAPTAATARADEEDEMWEATRDAGYAALERDAHAATIERLRKAGEELANAVDAFMVAAEKGEEVKAQTRFPVGEGLVWSLKDKVSAIRAALGAAKETR